MRINSSQPINSLILQSNVASRMTHMSNKSRFRTENMRWLCLGYRTTLWFPKNMAVRVKTNRMIFEWPLFCIINSCVVLCFLSSFAVLGLFFLIVFPLILFSNNSVLEQTCRTNCGWKPRLLWIEKNEVVISWDKKKS